MTNSAVQNPRDDALASEAQTMTTHLDVFGELVGSAGPLAYLHFDAAVFNDVMRPLRAARTQSLHAAYMDALFAQHIEMLASPAFLAYLHGELRQFVGLAFVPVEHREAVLTAIALTPTSQLTPQGCGRDAPALYVLFAARVHAYCETFAPT